METAKVLKSTSVDYISSKYNTFFSEIENLEVDVKKLLLDKIIQHGYILNKFIGKCAPSSPIERRLGIELLHRITTSKKITEYSLYPQYSLRISERVSPYLVDFMIEKKSNMYITQVAVECDSLQYHSTLEQKKADKARDAELLEYFGIPTLRIMGGRINYEVSKCADEIFNTVDALHMKNAYYFMGGGE